MSKQQSISYLRRTPGAEIVDSYGSYAESQFDLHEGIPVVIAARNEADDLPATLLSLAASKEPVHPIVIENGSSDETALFAKAMGATVLQSAIPSKVAALQLGIRELQATKKLDKPVLFTDADTLVGSAWAGITYQRAVEGTKSNLPVAVCGSGIFWHGPSRLTDVARTIGARARDLSKVMHSTLPAARGYNMALNFADDADLVEDYCSLDAQLFGGEEGVIIAKFIVHGGIVRRLFHPRSIVITRGDRFTTLSQCYAVKCSGTASRLALYAEEYGTGFYEATPVDI